MRAVTAGQVLRVFPQDDIAEILLFQDGPTVLGGAELHTVLVASIDASLFEQARHLRPGDRVEATVSVQLCILPGGDQTTFTWLEALRAWIPARA